MTSNCKWQLVTCTINWAGNNNRVPGIIAGTPFLFFKNQLEENFANDKNYSRTIRLESTSFDTMERNDVLGDWKVTVRV